MDFDIYRVLIFAGVLAVQFFLSSRNHAFFKGRMYLNEDACTNKYS